MKKILVLLLAFLCAGTFVWSASDTSVSGPWTTKKPLSALELVKTIPVRSSDLPQYSNFHWSPHSLAWSPDGKKIAYSSTGVRSFGVIDLETGQNTELVSHYKSEARVLWAPKLNYVVLVHATEFIVFDMSKTPAERLYSVENKFPKLLSHRFKLYGGSGIVTVNGKDLLVLIGDTTWRVDPSNPHIVVYDLKTGNRLTEFNYQFMNEPYQEKFSVRNDGDPGVFPRQAVVGLSSRQEILVTIYASRDLDKIRPGTEHALAPSRMERVVWTVNLNSKKIICDLKGQQDIILPDGSGISVNGYLSGSANNSYVLYAGHFIQSLYNVETCTNLHEMPQNERINGLPKAIYEKTKSLFNANQFEISDDGNFIFGFSYNGWDRKNAPFRLWSLADGKLLHDAYWPYDDGIATAAFSPDSKYLAWAMTDIIQIYKIKQ